MTAKSKLLWSPQSKKMREDAHYFRVFFRERRNRGLLGGETVDTNSRAPFADQDATAANAHADQISATAQTVAGRDGALMARQLA
jgi:hypothetical protein